MKATRSPAKDRPNTVEIDLSFDAGDDAILKARRERMFNSLLARGIEKRLPQSSWRTKDTLQWELIGLANYSLSERRNRAGRETIVREGEGKQGPIEISVIFFTLEADDVVGQFVW
jgi:hypothetical protein